MQTTLQERIAVLMRETGAKHADLMRVTKKTSSAISQIINGPTKSLNVDTAAAIEAEWGYRSEWLAYGKLPKRVSDQRQATRTIPAVLPAGHMAVTPEERLAIEAIRDLLPDDYDHLMEPIFERAEQMRKYRDFLLKKAGVHAGTATRDQVKHISKAPPYLGPERRTRVESVPVERRHVTAEEAHEAAARILRKGVEQTTSRGGKPQPSKRKISGGNR